MHTNGHIHITEQIFRLISPFIFFNWIMGIKRVYFFFFCVYTTESHIYAYNHTKHIPNQTPLFMWTISKWNSKHLTIFPYKHNTNLMAILYREQEQRVHLYGRLYDYSIFWLLYTMCNTHENQNMNANNWENWRGKKFGMCVPVHTRNTEVQSV